VRIAQVSPLFESVPPKYYGGTERVVSYLAEELVRQGHDVTLFASGDSVTKASLVAPCRRALRLDKHCVDQLAHHVLMMEMVAKQAASFDVIHFHIDYLHYPLSRRLDVPHVTTLHGRLDLPDRHHHWRRAPAASLTAAQGKTGVGTPAFPGHFSGLPAMERQASASRWRSVKRHQNWR
jgi:glycosyltransferase involved in cell wall biosynthesis